MLIFICAGSSAYADLYKWVDENGRVQYSDQPVNTDSINVEQLPTAPTTQVAPPAPAGDASASRSNAADDTGGGNDAGVTDQLIGSWSWQGKNGNETREFFPDGSYRSFGSDDFARTEASGTWTLKARSSQTVIVVRATYTNYLKSGEKISVSMNSRYQIKRISASEMILTDNGYESVWTR